MSKATITTIIKMVESLPDELQEKVADRLRDYIHELEEEAKWESSFKAKTPDKLIAAARQAKAEIAAGKSQPMDYEQL